MSVIERDFYMRDTLEVSKDLLGTILVHETPEGTVKGRIVEVEAYIGPGDAASHAYRNLRSKRTAVQFGPGGFSYVYFIYGMYYCMNIVTNLPARPEAVLIRALEPVEGVGLMQERRGTHKLTNLCSGPGKLCAAMGIDKSCYGLDLCGSSLYLEYGEPLDKSLITAAKRINIDYSGEAKDYEWRFYIEGNPHVSVKKRT